MICIVQGGWFLLGSLEGDRHFVGEHNINWLQPNGCWFCHLVISRMMSSSRMGHTKHKVLSKNHCRLLLQTRQPWEKRWKSIAIIVVFFVRQSDHCAHTVHTFLKGYTYTYSNCTADDIDFCRSFYSVKLYNSLMLTKLCMHYCALFCKLF